MANVGGLYVEIAANIARLVSGVDESRKHLRSLKSDVSGIHQSFQALGNIARTAFAGITVTSLIAGFERLIATTTKAGEEMLATSQKIGMSVEQLSALKFAADQSETAFEDITLAMGILSKKMYGMDESAQGNAKALKLLNVQSKDAHGILLELADRFSTMRDGVDKTALAMEIFGKSGKNMLPILNKGAAGILEMETRAKELGLVLSTDGAKAMDDYRDRIGELEGRLHGIAKSITLSVIPVFEQLFNLFNATGKAGQNFRLGTVATEIQSIEQTLANPSWNTSSRQIEMLKERLEVLKKMKEDILSEIRKTVEPVQKFDAPKMPQSVKATKELKDNISSLIDSFNDWQNKIDDLDPTLDDFSKRIITISRQAGDWLDKFEKAGLDTTVVMQNLSTAIDFIYMEKGLQMLEDDMKRLGEITKREAEAMAKAVRSAYEMLESELMKPPVEAPKTFAEGVSEGMTEYVQTMQYNFERGKSLAREAFTSMENFFEDLFLGKVKLTWQNLLGWMSGLFARFLSQLATQAIAMPIIVPVIQTLGGSAANIQSAFGGVNSLTGMGGGSASLFGMPLTNQLQGPLLPGTTMPFAGYTPLGMGIGALGGAGMGYGIGSMFGGYGNIGGAVGGAGGFLAGAGMGAWGGPVGMLIGSLLGGAIGSLFNDDSLAEQKEVKFRLGYKGSPIGYKYGGANWYGDEGWWVGQGGKGDEKVFTKQVNNQLAKTFNTIQESLKGFVEEMGGSVAKFDQAWHSKTYNIKSKEDLVNAINDMVGSYSEFLTRIDFTQFQKDGEELAETVGRIVDAVAAIPDLKSNIDDYIEAIQGQTDSIAKWREAIQEADKNLKEIEKSMRESTDPADQIKYANDLKAAIYDKYLAEKQLVEGLQDLIDNLQIELADFQINIQSKIAELSGDYTALINIPTQAMDTAKARMLEAATAAEKLEYIKQYVGYVDTWVSQNMAVYDRQMGLIKQWKSVAENVGNTLNNIQTSLSNPAETTERYAIAKRDVDRLSGLYNLASGEDKIEYAGQLQQAAQDMLAIAQERYQRPSSEYKSIYDEMITLLNSIQSDAEKFGSDNAMADDIKAFKEAAISYYTWAQEEGVNQYSQYITEISDKLTGILGDKSIEQYIAEKQAEAVTKLEDVKVLLTDILTEFKKGMGINVNTEINIPEGVNTGSPQLDSFINQIIAAIANSIKGGTLRAMVQAAAKGQ